MTVSSPRATTSTRSRRTRTPATSSDVRSFCPSCGVARYPCRTSDETIVMVDPTPRAGGHLLVNPYTCTIIAVQSSRGTGRTFGFVEHRAVCAARTPQPRGTIVT
jgi:hypothetical protein